MKKIYITTRFLSHGGVEKIVCNLSNLFIDMNYDVEILCTYYLGEPAYYLNNKVKVTYLINESPKIIPSLKERLKNIYLMKPNSLKDILNNISLIQIMNGFYTKRYQSYSYKEAIIKSIKNIENSIIISTINTEAKLISNYSKNNNKLIAQWHSDHRLIKGSLKDIKYKYKNIDYLLLLNEELRGEVEAELAGYKRNFECLTVPNFIVNQEDIHNIERKKQIISVGRLSPEKGFDRLLFIWKEFLVNNESYILKIVGDGQEKEKLIKLARCLNISDSVVFTGYLSNDETVKEIRKSKIYAMTSVHESFGIVLLEAITQGTPIIAYDVRVGPRSIIKDGYNGFLVKENDIEGFVEKLHFLLKEDGIYNNMSKNAIASSKIYSVEKLKDIWSGILE